MAVKHFGDPCIHCGIPHDDVPPGPCLGDPSKAIVIGHRSLGVVRPDGVEHYIYLTSDGVKHESWAHVGYHAPYYHFGRKTELTNPPPYMELTP